VCVFPGVVIVIISDSCFVLPAAEIFFSHGCHNNGPDTVVGYMGGFYTLHLVTCNFDICMGLFRGIQCP
jgi:hypothetical protein